MMKKIIAISMISMFLLTCITSCIAVGSQLNASNEDSITDSTTTKIRFYVGRYQEPEDEIVGAKVTIYYLKWVQGVPLENLERLKIANIVPLYDLTDVNGYTQRFSIAVNGWTILTDKPAAYVEIVVTKNLEKERKTFRMELLGDEEYEETVLLKKFNMPKTDSQPLFRIFEFFPQFLKIRQILGII
jgi:hypothetical protein